MTCNDRLSACPDQAKGNFCSREENSRYSIHPRQSQCVDVAKKKHQQKTFGEQFTKQNGSDTNSDAMATRKEHQPTKINRTTNDQRPSTNNLTPARRQPILQKRHTLHARNLKALAAAHVLAHHHVVAPQHIRLRLGKLRAIPIIRSRRQTFFLRPHQPLNLIFRRLIAMRTT